MPDDREVGGKRLRDLHLLVQGRHPGPGVEDVGDVAGPEQVQVAGRQVLGVADLDGVMEPIGQVGEERVKPSVPGTTLDIGALVTCN